MVCYHVLIADELIEQMPDFSLVGLRLVEESALSMYPGARWWKVEEPNGPPELEGKQVELWLQQIQDLSGIRWRILEHRVLE